MALHHLYRFRGRLRREGGFVFRHSSNRLCNGNSFQCSSDRDWYQGPSGDLLTLGLD